MQKRYATSCDFLVIWCTNFLDFFFNNVRFPGNSFSYIKWLTLLHDIKGEWCLRTPWYWSLSHWSILLKFIAPIIEVGDLWHAQCNLKPSKQRDSSLSNFVSDLKALFQYGRKVHVSRLNITKIIPIYPLVSSNSELDFQEKGKFLSTNILYRSCTIYFIWWINSPIKVDCASF